MYSNIYRAYSSRLVVRAGRRPAFFCADMARSAKLWNRFRQVILTLDGDRTGRNDPPRPRLLPAGSRPLPPLPPLIPGQTGFAKDNSSSPVLQRTSGPLRPVGFTAYLNPGCWPSVRALSPSNGKITEPTAKTISTPDTVLGLLSGSQAEMSAWNQEVWQQSQSPNGRVCRSAMDLDLGTVGVMSLGLALAPTIADHRGCRQTGQTRGMSRGLSSTSFRAMNTIDPGQKAAFGAPLERYPFSRLRTCWITVPSGRKYHLRAGGVCSPRLAGKSVTAL